RLWNNYGPELEAMEKVLARVKKHEEFYPELIAAYENESPLRYQRYLLHTSTVMENQKTLFSAGQELDKVKNLGKEKYTEPSPAGWQEFAAAMDTLWKKHGNILKTESARQAISEMGYL